MQKEQGYLLTKKNLLNTPQFHQRAIRAVWSLKRAQRQIRREQDNDQQEARLKELGITDLKGHRSPAASLAQSQQVISAFAKNKVISLEHQARSQSWRIM